MYEHKIIEFTQIQEDRKKGKLLKIVLPIERKVIYNILDGLKREIDKPIADFAVLKSLCFRFIQSFPFIIKRYQQCFLLRSRPNYNGSVFNKTSELIYNPTSSQVHLGRFNLEADPVFYCTDPIINGSFDAVLTGMSESCKELFDVNEKIQTQYFTIGKFDVVKPVTVLILSHYDKAESKCPYIQEINKYFNEILKPSYNKKDWEKCMTIYRFFSERAGLKYDNSNSYLLTTAFYHAAKEYYGPEIGVMYSSAMTENLGVNIVLSKEQIDAKYLKLDLIMMYKCIRNPSNPKHYTTFPCSNEARPDENGKFGILGIR